MSYYDDQDAPRRHRSGRDRDSRRNQPVYEEEEIIEKRRGPPRQEVQTHRELIRRQDSDDIEEVQREFPPGEGYGRRGAYRDPYPPRRARSDGRRHHDYDDYGGRRRRGYEDRRGHRHRDYSSSSDSDSPPPRRERRKSLGEQALAALGIGGAASALTGARSKSRDRTRDHRSSRSRRYDSSSSRSRSRTRGGGGMDREKIMQAAKAAVLAGAAEAFRSRKEPGGWAGDKGKRVLTAAIGAGGIDGLVSGDNPEKKSGRHTAEAVIGGLIGNRVLNGARDKSADRSRSRSRARSRGGGGGGGLEGLAAGGLAAAAGKAFLDYRNRSKSRGRRSYDSDDDSRSPPRNKKRSKSVSDYVSQGMAALGLKDDKGGRGDRRGRGYDSGYDDPYYQGSAGRLRGGGGEGGDGVKSDESDSDSDTSEISSSEEERRTKKMRGKEWITAGLASVATIHAAHSVYQSVENRKKRRKEVAEGKISPEEARKKKNKARLQDAASVGIAALGIKGAVSEWKEMKEQRDEIREFSHKCEERHQKKLLKSQENSTYGGSNDNYRNSDPNLYRGSYYPDTGPLYQDGNPYQTGGLPPPPMGPQHTR